MDERDINFASNLQTSEYWLNFGGDSSNTAAISIKEYVTNKNSNSAMILDDITEHHNSHSSIGEDYTHHLNMLNASKDYDHFIDDSCPELGLHYNEASSLSMWGSPADLNDFKIEEVFQVEKEDLFQGPTLAELNANDESLFDTLNDFDFTPAELKSEKKISSNNSSIPPIEPNEDKPKCISDCTVTSTVKNNDCFKKNLASCKIFEPQKNSLNGTNDSSNSSIIKSTKKEMDVPVMNKNIKDEEVDNINDIKSYCKPASSVTSDQTDSFHTTSKALVHTRPRKCSNKIQTFSCSKNVCKVPQSTSNYLDYYSEDDDDSSSSFAESDDDESEDFISQKRSSRRSKDSAEHSKQAPCFWQYNTQLKGPKLKHACSNEPNPGPSKLQELLKTRRCDSNDLTPCPQKLYKIGTELEKLNTVINSLTPVNAVPFNARPKCRKEKNKFASRVCRLKKKAQYEANKLKLYGLQQEYSSLENAINKVKEIIADKVKNAAPKESCQKLLESACGKQNSVADSQIEFVNCILKNVESGDPTGGLEEWFDNPADAMD